MTKEKKERLYFAKVAIVGQSGTGKSYMTKTADRATTGYINFERKPLPYKAEPFKFEGRPSSWTGFRKNFQDYVKNPEVKGIVIDSFTMALNTLIKEMGERYSGFDVYKFYNKEVYQFLEELRSAEKDIFVFAHDELAKSDDGERIKRMATHGREFDGKLEQHFTIVLYTGTRYKDNKPEYFLKTFEPGASAKSPEGLFDSIEIPNDAGFILNSLEEYYSN
jgi:hypothetical protein